MARLSVFCGLNFNRGIMKRDQRRRLIQRFHSLVAESRKIVPFIYFTPQAWDYKKWLRMAASRLKLARPR